MEFSNFPQANTILKAAPGTESYVRDLPIYRQLPFVVSCLQLDEAERAQLAEAGCIFLQVLGDFAGNLGYLQHFALVAEFAQAGLVSPLYGDFRGANAAFQLGSLEVPVFIQPLPGHELLPDRHPAAVLCFVLPEGELATICSTGQLFVRAMGQTHPPISVHVTSPLTFEEVAEAEPT